MVKKGIFIFATFAALAFASEIEDGEQKKRGAGKATALNAIPTGAQKPDYTYNIYSQSPSAQSSPSQSYHSQSNSYYPNQISNQYYSPANNPDPSTSNPAHSQASSQILPLNTQSQFVPINFVPNPGYQSKYQIVSPKPSGNVQLAIIQPSIQPSPIFHYPHSYFSANPTNHIGSSNAVLSQHGSFSITPAFQPLSLGGSFIGQPSMVMLPQGHSSLYNNLVYPNPTQSFYNYYPSTSQARYSYASGVSSQTNDYDKTQSVSQSLAKDDVSSNEYITPSDPNSSYKNAYSQNTYSKL